MSSFIRHPAVRSITAILACALITGTLLTHALMQRMNQDEEQYVAAAILSLDHTLYQDFIYLQPPIYPLLLAAIFKLFDAPDYFQLARLLSGALAAISVTFVFLLSKQLSRSLPFAAIATALFATSPIMLLAFGSARNDIMPVCFGLVGVWCMFHALQSERVRPVFLFFSGVLFAFAVGSKITSAFLPAAALFYVWFRSQRLSGSTLQLMGVFVAGGFLGSLPIIYYFWLTPEQFFYGTYTFHRTGPIQYYQSSGSGHLLDRGYQLKYFIEIILSEPALVLAVLFGIFALFLNFTAVEKPLKLSPILTSEKFFIALACLFAVPLVLTPLPFWSPYLQPLIPYIILGCAALYPKTVRDDTKLVIGALLTVAVVVTGLQAKRLIDDVEVFGNKRQATTVELHHVSLLIKKALRANKIEGPIASLYPLLVLNAGSPVMNNFASAVYFYRSGDNLKPEEVLRLNGASPSTLSAIFATDEPGAIFTADTKLEKSLQRWARDHCYHEDPDAFKDWQAGPYNEPIWKPKLFIKSHKSCP